MVLETFRALLAADIFGDELHRPRPVQRDQRDDVVEALGRRLQQKVAHPARFELEHGRGVAFFEYVIGRLVVERQRLERQARAGVQFF